jgi:hypothetical protein
MKTHLAALLLATSALLAPVASITPSAAKSQPICGAELPRPYDRPGGFCDLRVSTTSLSTPVESTAPATPVVVDDPDDCLGTLLFIKLRLGERVRVAC